MTNVETSLRNDVLEHVMRCTDDDLVVLPFLTAEPGSPEAFEAVGRLVTATPTPLQPGTPLAVFCNGGTVDPHWRANVTDTARSLWGALAVLDALNGNDPGDGSCHYERYVTLSSADYA